LLYKAKAEVEAERGTAHPLTPVRPIFMSAPGASIGEKVKDVKGEHPHHIVIIKCVPTVGDPKHAIDVYLLGIMDSGRSIINVFNECEDSLLATPLILGLTILAELFTRIKYRKLTNGPDPEFKLLYPVHSLLSYMLNAPLVKPGVYILFIFLDVGYLICDCEQVRTL
jgi:myo-inositol-1-phosphate synthase